MIRKATASVLLLLLGLYLPAASMTLCVCLNPAGLDEMESCCAEEPNCCGDSDCCITIPGLPDGMEPQWIEAPNPVSLPAPLIRADEFAVLPMCELSIAALPSRAPPPPPGAPIRIAHGVWRL